MQSLGICYIQYMRLLENISQLSLYQTYATNHRKGHFGHKGALAPSKHFRWVCLVMRFSCSLFGFSSIAPTDQYFVTGSQIPLALTFAMMGHSIGQTCDSSYLSFSIAKMENGVDMSGNEYLL